MVRIILIVATIVFSYNELRAIGDDSTYHRFDPNWTKFRSWNNPYEQTIDTSLTLFQRYHPAMRDYFMRNTGNLGYPAYRLIPLLYQAPGLRTGINAFDVYMYKADDVKFYNTRKPYTSLYYLMGSGNEQWFQGNHTQNIGKNYNVGFAFNRIGSDGTYANMRTDYYNILAHQSFKSNNQRYTIDFCAYRNKAVVQFNGGVSADIDSVYINPAYITKKVVPVNLDSATTQITERNLSIKQQIHLGPTYQEKVNDTLTKKQVDTKGVFIHRFDFNENVYRFTDDKTDFAYFPQVLNNTEKTRDSIAMQTISNELRFFLPEQYKLKRDSLPVSNQMSGAIYARHRLYRFAGDAFDNVQNLNIGAEWFKFIQNKPGTFKQTLWSNTGLFINAEYSLIDYNKGEYSYSGTITRRIFQNLLNITYYGNRLMPSVVEQRFRGNHFQWDNRYRAVTNSCFRISYTAFGDKLRVAHAQGILTNPVYFGQNALPVQLNGSVNYSLTSLKLLLKFSKLYFGNEIAGQYFSNEIMQYPRLFSAHSVYYANTVFKKSLQFQIGMDVFNNGNFNPYDFNVNTSQYFVQAQRTYGQYIWTDAFVNLKIRSVRVLFKVDNVLQGILGNGTDLIPQWPLPDRSLKLIVNWMFWN